MSESDCTQCRIAAAATGGRQTWCAQHAPENVVALPRPEGERAKEVGEAVRVIVDHLSRLHPTSVVVMRGKLVDKHGRG